MNKKDIPIIVLLFVLLIAWPKIWPMISPPAPVPVEPPVEEPVAAPSEFSTMVPAEAVGLPVATKPVVAEPAVEAVPEAPEQTVQLESDTLVLTITSHGGGIQSAMLKDFPAAQADDPERVVLDFSDLPALSLSGLPGLSEAGAFTVISEEDGRRVRLERTLGPSLKLERTLELDAGYLLRCTDRLVNLGDEPLMLPAHALNLGRMRPAPGVSKMRGMSFLGVDAYASSMGVKHWSRKLSGFFKKAGYPETIRLAPEEIQNVTLDWVAAKNKFFVQILTPQAGTASGMQLEARRNPAAKGAEVVETGARIQLDEALLPAGGVLAREQGYYVGPKKYDELKALGLRRDGVMELGKMGWAGRPLLNTLNAIYRVVPNYGVAIIVLTLLVRILFWPVTHKSTESMRKMSALQPQIKALQAKFKDNPQRMQQETMKLYKENKVNPLGGCVPLLVQIPVFIALFTVLRSAVELRFAPFLWISDLSEPENLLAGVLPLPLNILPLLMVATMFIQQKLTPAAGDPQQQKMMAIMMPLMMLFFFYTMPSGLVLYWTTSQVSMIVQLLVRKEREKRAKA